MIGKEKVSVFHVSSVKGTKKIKRIIGKKSTLSTFTKVDKGENFQKEEEYKLRVELYFK